MRRSFQPQAALAARFPTKPPMILPKPSGMWRFARSAKPCAIVMDTQPPVIFAIARKGMLYWNRTFRFGVPLSSDFLTAA